MDCLSIGEKTKKHEIFKMNTEDKIKYFKIYILRKLQITASLS